MPGCCVCQRTVSTYVCHICHDENLKSLRQAISSLRNQQQEELARIHSLLDRRRQAQSPSLARYHQQTQSTKLSIQKLQSHLQSLQSTLHHVNSTNKERHLQLKEAVRSLLNNSNSEEHHISRHNHELSIVLTATQGILFQQQRSRVIRIAMSILPLDLVTTTTTKSLEEEAGGEENTPDESTSAIKTHLPSPSPTNKNNNNQSKHHQQNQAPLAVLGGQLLPRSLTDMTSSTALGYAALLIDLFSRFLNLPLLLRLNFQGSTSHIWTPDTWWDTRTSPPSRCDALPLFKLRPTADKQATVMDRHRQMMLEGLQLVQRAAGELVYTVMGGDATCRVPPDWPPFAWLAGLMKILGGGAHGDDDDDGVLVVVQPNNISASNKETYSTSTSTRMNLGVSMVFGRREKHNNNKAISSALHMMPREGYSTTMNDHNDDDDDDSEWELMPARVMAPPPSQPDEVVHWENSHWSTSSAVMVLSAGTGTGTQRLSSNDIGGGGGGEGMYGRRRVGVVVERLKRAWSGRLT